MENGLLSDVIPGTTGLDDMPPLMEISALTETCSEPTSPVNQQPSPQPSSQHMSPPFSPNLSPKKSPTQPANSLSSQASQEQGKSNDSVVCYMYEHPNSISKEFQHFRNPKMFSFWHHLTFTWSRKSYLSAKCL